MCDTKEVTKRLNEIGFRINVFQHPKGTSVLQQKF